MASTRNETSPGAIDAETTAEPAPAAAPAEDQIERAISAFQEGNERERHFRILFEHFYPSVLRFFAKRAFSTEDRFDLTQETFLRVYRGLEGFRREASFGTWLFRIAHNTHLKWLRRLHPDEESTLALPEEDAELPGWETADPAAIATEETALDGVLDDERHRLLREAIAELPAQMRECTRLRVYRELSYREISVAMQLSVETVKVHLFQARKKLKKRLQDQVDVDI